MVKILALTLLLAAPTFAANNLIEDTAIVALKVAKRSSTGTKLEHGGMIFRRDGGEWGPLIEYLEPLAGDRFDGVKVIDLALLQPSDKLLATYHLHLCMSGYYHELFSRQDIRFAVLTGLPEFMLDECTGDVHAFDPKLDKVFDSAKPVKLFGKHCEKVDDIYLPVGRIIGNIGETEVERKVPDETAECAK